MSSAWRRYVRLGCEGLGLVCVVAAATPARAGEEAPPPVERELAAEARLPTILRVIGERNAELREAGQRAEAAEARIGASGRLPDPELKGELWGVPLARPLSFDQSQTILLGLRQAFPAWGSRDAKARASREEAAGIAQGVEARRQDLAARARRAFAMYGRSDREYRIHLEHVGLTSRLVEIARSLYQTGRGTQQDLLRAQVELSRLHVDLASLEQERRSAQALLNALMDRAPDAPLGPVAATPDAAAADGGFAAAERQLDARRPELRAAAHAVGRGEAALEATRREAERPAFMVGADYWYMPMFETRHGYGAMVTMSLPWLNPARRDEVRAAERASAADKSALRAQQAAARFELRDADAKVSAARETLALVHGRVLADARRAFESAQATYQGGQGDLTSLLDAARGYLEVRIEEVRAVAALAGAEADYARAAGLPAAGIAASAGPEERR